MAEPFQRFAQLELPPFRQAAQRLDNTTLEKTKQVSRRASKRGLADCRVTPGQRIAVALGSRGLSGLMPVLKGLLEAIGEVGAEPVIIPAMGSHGGATAEGQIAVLASLGISEETTGCRIISSLEADRLGASSGGAPVFFSRDALACDHVICINRIKAHTKFRGSYQSGLAKMLVVGLGKHVGAAAFHSHGLVNGHGPMLAEMAEIALSRSNFRFGLAMVENGHGDLAHLEAVSASELMSREPELLTMADEMLPRLPFKKLDVLIVREMGKDISGLGMDPNVVGRSYDVGDDDYGGIIAIKRLAALSLTPKSGGNALGLGNADIITRRLYEAHDPTKTATNALTSGSWRKAAIPMVAPNDELAIKACFATLGPVAPAEVKAAIIQSTKSLEHFLISPALEAELAGRDDIRLGETTPLDFSPEGDLFSAAD